MSRYTSHRLIPKHHCGLLISTILILTRPIPLPASENASPTVAILDLSTPGIEPTKGKSLSTTLVNIIAAEVARLGHKVISSADIQAMLSLERQKDILGCQDNLSCLAEIGGALGTELLLSGSVGLMGESYNLSLSLIDNKRVQVTARFSGNAGSEAVLTDTVRRGVQVLFGKIADTSGTGAIFLKTEPSGATVFLDGKEVGLSPLTLDGIPTGDHALTAFKDELRGQATVLVKPESIERLSLSLKAAPPVKLKVFSSPPEARVEIDGREMGATPIVLEQVAAGKRQLRLMLDGYQTAEATLDLSAEAFERQGREAFKHEVTLVPQPVPLKVTGLPPGAMVAIDGQRLPTQGLVAPGKHRLQVEAAGYQPVDRLIDVSVGHPAEIAARLAIQPAFQAYQDLKRRQHTWGGIQLGLAGAAAVTGAVVFGLGHASKQAGSDAYQDYQSASEPSEVERLWGEVEDHHDRANHLALAGEIVWGVGAAALLGGILTLALSPHPPTSTASSGSVSAFLRPQVGGGAVAGIQGRWPW